MFLIFFIGGLVLASMSMMVWAFLSGRSDATEDFASFAIEADKEERVKHG